MTVIFVTAILAMFGTQLALSMKCNKIDVVILNGSGILLQDDTVLAREGQPLYIGCYCSNHPNTVISWKTNTGPITFDVSNNRHVKRVRRAVSGASKNQSVYLLTIQDFQRDKFAGIYSCNDKGGYMTRHFEFKCLVDSTRTFDGDDSDEPNYFLSKLTFINESTIIAGAMEKLYLLDSELNQKNMLEWKAHAPNAKLCKMHVKERPDYVCKNHIRFFHRIPQQTSNSSSTSLVVCGTGALYPNCTIVENLENFRISEDKLYQPKPGMVLVHPDLTGFQAFRNLYEGDPVLFSAQHRSFQMELYGFAYHNLSIVDTPEEGHRIVTMDPFINALEKKKHWLRSPVAFIDGYDDNFSEEDADPDSLNFFFFFFHEQAYDIRNGDMKIHSRVARLCKNDPGVPDNSHLVFSSFVKARISCMENNNFKDVTHPGAVKFYYNVIRKVKLMKGSSYKPELPETDRILYGAFTGDRLGPQGSAICVYNATRSLRRPNNNGIYDIFNRDYVDVRENINGECEDDRKTTPNLKPFDCSAPRPAEKAKSENLIYALVSQLEQYPLVVVDDATIISMEVDKTLVLRQNRLVPQDVIFIGTDSGEIRKIFIGPYDADPGYKANTVETLMLEPYSYVHHMTLKTITNDNNEKEKVIYANTNSTLFRLPLQRCARFNDCTECVAAMDPYCFWDVESERCTVLPSTKRSGELEEEFLQDVDYGDYTKFEKCSGRNAGTKCRDIRDCPDNTYCQLTRLRHLTELPPSTTFVGKIRGDYIQNEMVPLFSGNWTLFIRFWHRKGTDATLLYLGKNRINGDLTLAIEILPQSRSIQVKYKTLPPQSMVQGSRINVSNFNSLRNASVNCLALSYNATGRLHMYYSPDERVIATGGIAFRDDRDKSVFILGSGPYDSNRLAGKVNATLYYPELLNRKQIHTVCEKLLENKEEELTGYCLPKNQ